MNTHVIPDEQHHALMAALGERFGINIGQTTDLRAETNGSGMVRIEWTEVRIMPEAEFVEMFNAAGQASESDD